MERIYLTGAFGKLGRAVFKAIGNPRCVTAVSRSKIASYGNLVGRYHCTDITDPRTINITDEKAVIHCAGMVSFNERDTAKIMRVNFDGTVNLVIEAEKAGVETFVFVSSAITRGFSEGSDPRDEASKNIDENPYTRSKLLAEHSVISSSIPNRIIVYPTTCNVYEIVEAVAKSAHPLAFPGITNIADIDDVAASIVKASRLDGVRRFILGGPNIKYSELVNIAIDELGQDKKPVDASRPLIKKAVAAAVLFSKHPIYNRYVLRNLYKNKCYSSKHAIQLLDHNVKSPEEIIRKAVAQYEQNTRDHK